MGFYGNITNTSNTTFQFDRIYSNRLAMDANANNDGIFIGRYVLVEYDQKAAISNIYINTSVVIDTIDNTPCYYGYSSPNISEIATRINYGGTQRNEDKSVDKYYQGEFGQVQITLRDDYGTLQEAIQFYQCIGEKDGYALFISKAKVNTTESNYIKNFAIDEGEYSKVSNGFKGYDSTVWTKVSETNESGVLITKYVNIADLNSVVPTFDIAADAPTMTPITPHFDADSTNVYYKLHMQSPYGFRVKQGIEGQSDDDTVWYRTTYNKEKDETKTEIVYDGPADIYYNQAGFNPEMPSKVSNKAEDNYIKLEPTGESGAVYAHGGRAKDIQEFSLHLPAIGNMMSDAWDIIHGPNRDDAQTDNNSSLQGRLDSFKAMEKDAIPMKRNTDGTFVGSRINGNSNRIVGTNKILEENLSTSFDQDDAWIRTEIDTTGLDNTNKLSGISIHHTFHEDNTNYDFFTNKNVDKVESENESDKIKLYTPKVDAAGHVVGKSIETVTLPYGYKTIKVTNTDNEAVLNAAQAINSNGQIADNTQDELTLSASNRWVKLDNNTEDTIKIGHQVNIIEEKDKDLTDLNDGTDTITVQDTIYDEAGHVTANQKHTYTLPYGYKVIKTLNSEGVGQADIDLGTNYKIVANKTQDEMQFEAANKWIGIMATEEGNVDKIYLGHLTNGNGFGKTYYAKDSNLSNDDVYKQIPNFGDNVKILNVTVDNAGHVTGFNANTITIPQGSYTPANNAEKHTDIITSIGFTPSTGAIISTKATTGTLTLSNYSANNGNLNILYTDTINEGFEKIQNHINSLDMESTSTTEFITEITQTDGQVAVKRAAAGTLQLGTPSSDGTIPANSSLNNAFNITNNRIKAEEDALAKEIQDRKDAIDALTGTKDYSEHFDTMKEIADWLDANKDGVVDITLNVTANAKAISDEAAFARDEEGKLDYAIKAEALRADTEEKKIAAALTTETGRATAAEQANTTAIENEKTRAEGIEAGLQEQINALGTAAKENKEYFATAAQGVKADTTAATIATYGDIVTHNHSEYATAAQGELADNALPKDTEFIYIEEFKDTETGEILIPEVKMTIEQLVKKVAELENEIKILKGE